MAVATPAKNTPLLELKSASLTLVAVVMRSPDLALLAQDLAEREAVTPGLFDKDPVAIDLWRVREAEEPIDFVALIALLRSHSLVPVAARGGNRRADGRGRRGRPGRGARCTTQRHARGRAAAAHRNAARGAIASRRRC